MKSRVRTAVGGRKLDLTHLDRVIYPESGIVKAEVIEYYLKMAPIILRHAKGRMMTFVRYPDGIDKASFFQKNRPEAAPDWVATTKHEDIDYILLDNEATLVWAGNQSALELHQVSTRHPHHDLPDYVIFDVDPPEDFPYRDLVGIVLELRSLIECHGHQPFVKTSGRKGFHLVCPIHPQRNCDQVKDAAEGLAKEFVRRNRQATLAISKKDRRDKVLIDVGRNRPSQTTISPYSLRGLPGAPVSVPVRWEELEESSEPLRYTIRNAHEKVTADGDPWEGMAAFATGLFDDEPQASSDSDSLDAYAAKRHFDRTPEPPASPAEAHGRRFVLQRHRARRLHYDLRLEVDGVLQSWAVPKGLPPRPGIKRLAIRTEDHPLEYLTFEGHIPKGQYGGGDMDIFASGTYEVTKSKPDLFYLRLGGGAGLDAEYRMINTRDADWLCERVDPPETEWLQSPPEVMLPESADVPPTGPDYLFEVKWDGIRVMITIEDRKVRLTSRRGKDATLNFPEVVEALAETELSNAVFDGELLCLDEAGRPQFTEVVGRFNESERWVAASQRRNPACCYLFDCLYLDGATLARRPLHERRKWLEKAVKPGATVRISECVPNGEELHKAAIEAGLEGTIAKDRNSIYRPGLRSGEWIKIKGKATEDCLIVGYIRNAQRGGAVKSAILAQDSPEGLRHVGNVSVSGPVANTLTEAMGSELPELKGFDARLAESACGIGDRVYCEVRFSSWTKAGKLRDPVFLRFRPDLA